ncbi:hypothetical protein MBLNU459_g3568t1 [Dothideomycetes sp. NU459]
MSNLTSFTAASEPSTTTSATTVISLGNGVSATAQGSDVVIANSTISVGGPAFTDSSTTISLASSGIINVDGTTTSYASVTSTMTTLPSGVSTQEITISGVSTNTWYTTSKDGHTTVLPVVWCPNCGGGKSVLIWNLPSNLINIDLDWASYFPKLPTINFPCIKVFGVTVGDCPPAETEDSDDPSSSDDGSSTSATSQSTTWSSLSVETPEWYFGATYTGTGDDNDTSTATTTDSQNTTTAASASITSSSMTMTDGLNTTTAATSSLTSSSITTSDGLNTTTATATVTSMSMTSSSATNPWCTIYGGPSVPTAYCECGQGSNTVTSPAVSGSCPYTSHALTSSGASTTAAPALPGTTTTTFFNGIVKACTSYSMLDVDGSGISVCEGPTIYSPTTSSAQPTQSCGTDFSSSLDKLFEIHGKGWDSSVLGNGDVFKDNLAKCSGNDVSDWDFSVPPSDGTTWDFLAAGTMKGVGACYEQAAIDSGGCLVGGSKTLPSGS